MDPKTVQPFHMGYPGIVIRICVVYKGSKPGPLIPALVRG